MEQIKLERLPRFSWAEIKKHIEEKKPFEALSPMGTACIRIADYQPLMALAVHAGHEVREELLSKMAIEEDERRLEEDVGVDKLISGFPIQMISLDSRYEYDLNRSRNEAVYLKPFQSWGKKVWLMPPTKDELAISDQKYDEFHELMLYMVGEILKIHQKVLILDVHTYDNKRPRFLNRPAPLPLFDVGTSNINRGTFGKSLDYFLSSLKELHVPGQDCIVKENVITKGNGAIEKGITSVYEKALVLSIEIKKIFYDDEKNQINTTLLNKIADHLVTVGKNTLQQT